eukprot:1196457-Amphidinium_carterae.2
MSDTRVTMTLGTGDVWRRSCTKCSERMAKSSCARLRSEASSSLVLRATLLPDATHTLDGHVRWEACSAN